MGVRRSCRGMREGFTWPNRKETRAREYKLPVLWNFYLYLARDRQVFRGGEIFLCNSVGSRGGEGKYYSLSLVWLIEEVPDLLKSVHNLPNYLDLCYYC
jgi:hypothetical protein